ncbi:MAG: hypothetical protein V4485_00110 [Pseudomonadota bacterium]
MLKIVLLVSAVNMGDVGNAQETLHYLEQKIHAPLEIITIDASKDAEVIARELKNSKSSDPKIIIAIGDNGLKALKAAQGDALDKAYVYWSGHQFFDSLDVKSLHIDHIALPEFAMTESKKVSLEDVRLTATFGVPTKNLSKEELKDSYDSWKAADKPELSKKYIIVMLPGDAPDIDGKINVYTPESNKDLFDKVYAFWKKHADYEVLVQNGPRTGKYDIDDTKKVVCNHEYKKGESPSLDKISEQFIEWLKSHDVPYKFYNFTFEVDGSKKIPHSVANQLLYLSTLTGNYCILPAESVSLLSQVTSYLDPQHIIAFAPDSMNAEHRKLLEMAFGLGYLSKFAETEGDKSVVTPTNKACRNQNDAEDAAFAIVDGFHAKFPEINLLGDSHTASDGE